MIKILLLEDSPLDAELIKRELNKGNIYHEMLVVRNKEKFQQALKDFPADIILSDHSLPQFNSNEALHLVQLADIDIPFILITSTMTDEFAVGIMREGADDYILKDRLSRLPSAINNAIEKFRLAREQKAERIKVNDELKGLNYRLQLAVKSADLGIWDWDILNDDLKWDIGMHQLYDLEDETFGSVYGTWISKLHPEDKFQINEEIQLAITGKKKYDTEYRVLGRYDHIHTLRATGIVEWNEQGEPVRMIGVCWDITKQKLAALEREEIIKEVSRRNAELEQFSYIISHNLRAPVANIIGASNAMNDQEVAAEDRRIFNKAIHQSAVGLDNIIKDLNHILEIKGTSYTKEEVLFSELVEDIKLNIDSLLLENDFKIICNFSAIEEIFTVRLYLYSIFYNLISNSIKYRRGDINGILEIKSEHLDGKAVLLFTDNGTGIDLEKNGDHIFGLYKRFHLDLPGKGMGLFMVKSQVEILGGHITVDSSENNGTKFRIEFK